MKYNDKHPQVVAHYRSYAVAMTPPPETHEFYSKMEPEPGIVYSGMAYPCETTMGGCGKNTCWTDISWGVAVHCCSEECKKAMDDQCAEYLARTGVDLKTEEVPGIGRHESHYEEPECACTVIGGMGDPLSRIGNLKCPVHVVGSQSPEAAPSAPAIEAATQAAEEAGLAVGVDPTPVPAVAATPDPSEPSL